MKRYYLSPIVGNGSIDNPYRAKVADYGVNNTAVIPTGSNGAPLFSWCLAVVDAPSHSAILADGAIDALPDVALDMKLSAMRPQTWQTLVSRANARGIDLTGFSATGNSSDAHRDVVRYLGRLLQPSFDENAFDVSG